MKIKQFELGEVLKIQHVKQVEMYNTSIIPLMWEIPDECSSD